MSRSRPLDWSMTKIFVTRMHSSRMRTVRCSGRGGGGGMGTGVWRGGVYAQGWHLPGGRGVAAQRGSNQGCVWPGGVCLGGGGLTGVEAVCPRGSYQGVSADRGVYLSMHWAGGFPVDRILDTHLWKHNLSTTTLWMVKKIVWTSKLIADPGERPRGPCRPFDPVKDYLFCTFGIK